MTMTAAPVTSDASRFVLPVDDGWEVAPADAGESTPAAHASGWIPARVPGTVAGAYRDAGRAIPQDLDDRDWLFRTTFDAEPAGAGEEVVLHLDGIATVADVMLDGRLIASVESMFIGETIDITDRVGGTHELLIRCRALTPLLALPRRPRARWRTALVQDANLRWLRTSLLGRAPGFSPGPPVVGPWRPIRLERRRGIAVDDLRVRAQLHGLDGRLSVRARLRAIDGDLPDRVVVELAGPSGHHAAGLRLIPFDDGVEVAGELTIPRVATWWPHTHGRPERHEVSVVIGAGARSMAVDAGSVGFRTIAPGPGPDHDLARDGIDLHVNGTRIFARGAVWTPSDAVSIAVDTGDLRRSLELVRDAGMNMLRVPGIGLYESDEFHALCDELGILVWQDLMFANLDYPFGDDAFRSLAEREVAQLVDRLGGRPSTTVICGSSEVEQQVAMLGLDPDLGRDPFYDATLRETVTAAGSDAILIPSAPSGGDLPFRPDRGVANYYGVGGYRRPLSDARTAGVRFAAECLAFSNVPDDPVVDLDDPAWDAGVPRDKGSDWDFEDVRDHYLETLRGVDADQLRRDAPGRYLALSRAISGEVMAEVFGEWRRNASPCGGGLILWWRDVVPGAGWGLIDHGGRPKTAYHHVRRVLAPVAVWTTDEGLAGIAVHVANDRPEPLAANLRVALYRDGEIPVGEATIRIDLPAHGAAEHNVESILGRFVDVSWAYRFGPSAQDLVVARLDALDGDPARPLSQAVRFPVGRPMTMESADQLGLEARVVDARPSGATLEVRSRRVVDGVRIEIPGFAPDDDAITIEPGHPRRIDLRSVAGSPFGGGSLTALNLAGRFEVGLR